jgi:GNAT superfamily N-acetyltransferase
LAYDPEPLTRQIPETPAGRQLAWWATMQAGDGEGVLPTDVDRYAPEFLKRVSGELTAERLVEIFRGDGQRLGAFVELGVVEASDFAIVALARTSKDRKLKIHLTVDPDPPHRIARFLFERQHDFKLEVREAGPDDALIVADIERRCPIVMGDTSVWFDRGAEYFAFSRLLEDCTVGLASVDGIPAAVSCGAERVVRVGGELKRLYVVSHLRVLPEHQRKGLWGAANSALSKYRDLDGSQAYIAVDNLGMQHGFQGTPDKWGQIVQRVELDCAALAGPPAGRPSTPEDAAEIAARLNAFHGPEELYVPYDAAGFARRVERAPDLYGWDKVWLDGGALVGVWPAGQALRTVTDNGGVQTVSTPAVVMDYAFAPGAEAEFETLLQAWSGALSQQGIDTLIIYTSPASPGSKLITGLARSTGDFFTWTPGIPPPADSGERGLYTDAAYF